MLRKFKIPLKLINLADEGFHLLVKVVVYGKKGWAVVDSGASRTVFDSSFIKEHTKEYITTESGASTLFSTTETMHTTLPSLQIGTLAIEDYPIVAIDLEAVNQAYEQMGHRAIIGIIGCDLLYEFRTVINWDNFQMTFKVDEGDLKKKPNKKSKKKTKQ